MKLHRLLLPFVVLGTLLGADSSLPPSTTAKEEVFVALVRRAFAEANPDILVALTYRRPPPDLNPKLQNVREHRSKLIARGLHSLGLTRIEPPTRDVRGLDGSLMQTDIPAGWILVIWHSPHSKTTIYGGEVGGAICIVIPHPLPNK